MSNRSTTPFKTRSGRVVRPNPLFNSVSSTKRRNTTRKMTKQVSTPTKSPENDAQNVSSTPPENDAQIQNDAQDVDSVFPEDTEMYTMFNSLGVNILDTQPVPVYVVSDDDEEIELVELEVFPPAQDEDEVQILSQTDYNYVKPQEPSNKDGETAKGVKVLVPKDEDKFTLMDEYTLSLSQPYVQASKKEIERAEKKSINEIVAECEQSGYMVATLDFPENTLNVSEVKESKLAFWDRTGSFVSGTCSGLLSDLAMQYEYSDLPLTDAMDKVKLGLGIWNNLPDNACSPRGPLSASRLVTLEEDLEQLSQVVSLKDDNYEDVFAIFWGAMYQYDKSNETMQKIVNRIKGLVF